MDQELIFWIVAGIICGLAMLLLALPWNEEYDPSLKDPYRFCPKDKN